MEVSRSLANPWVLQRYVDDPLLVEGRKFHMRVNVLAAGSPVRVRAGLLCMFGVCTPLDAQDAVRCA